MDQSIIDGYGSEASALAPAFETIDSAELLKPITEFLPSSGRALDVGAGTGRDAAWLTSFGHDVVAVEPVAHFREVGMRLHRSQQITWVNDSLPLLRCVLEMGNHFDLMMLVAVWQHVAPAERLTALKNLRGLAAACGRLIISVRHGPGSPARTCFPVTDLETIRLAGEAGFVLLARRYAESVQRKNRDAGVTWTWLAFSAV